MELALAVAGLLLPALLGIGAGAVRLFDDPDRAVAHLNRFALYVAFPPLIYVGIAAGDEALPTGAAFWLAVPLALAVTLIPLRAVGRWVGGGAGTMALVVSFGNVAYLGLPVVQTVLGDAVMATASLIVSLHVLMSLLVGPVMLLVWSGGDGREAIERAVRKLAVQPLFWAPLVGVGARWAPEALRVGSVALLAPLGKAAAPTALFLLGLHLHTHRRRLARIDAGTVAHVVAKMGLLPLVTVGVILALRPLGLPEGTAPVLLLLSAMPPAITTFAIATEFETGADRVAQAVVVGTTLAAVVLPLVAWVVTGGVPMLSN